MSEATIQIIAVALMAAIPPTLTAYAALRQSRRNEVKVDKNTGVTEATMEKAVEIEAKTVEIELKTAELVVKSDEIHQLTNSNLTAVKADLIRANEQIKELQTLVTSLVGSNGPKVRQILDTVANDVSVAKTSKGEK